MAGEVEQAAEAAARARAMWAAGDYDAVSAKIAAVGERIVRHTAVREGDVVLDVACGTGNATIPAARMAARTVGLDLTPELFGPLRAHALSAGVEVELVEGDAQALPFEDDSFDVVLSTFGVMFAPDHQRAAAELARVVRPGGRLGVCSWTPDGEVGAFFRTVSSHMPAPPPGFQPPVLWGVEQHVAELFAGTGVELEFEREQAEMRFRDVDDAVGFYETRFGPVLMAKALLEPQGRWPELRDALTALFAESARDDGVVFTPEYLVAVGRRPA
jgi:ubiquinone/menaquinone biosynthesis C-methylase UbiE